MDLRLICLAVAVVTCAETADGAPKKAASVDHTGPAGVAWYSSPDDAKAKWADRWEIQRELKPTKPGDLDFVQRFSGKFSDLETELIEAGYTDGKLVSLVVWLPQNDERPATRRWEELNEKMRDAYGEPVKIEKEPDVSSGLDRLANTAHSQRIKERIAAHAKTLDDLTGGKYDKLDRAVRLGEWKPAALWKFRNGATSFTTIMPSQPDEDGNRYLTVIWAFTAKPLRQILPESKKVRDF